MLTPYYRPLLANPPNPDAGDSDGVKDWAGFVTDLNPYCRRWLDLIEANNEAMHGPGSWFPWQSDSCDHDWKFCDESFDHEFGTERVHFFRCEKCEAEKPADHADSHEPEFP